MADLFDWSCGLLSRLKGLSLTIFSLMGSSLVFALVWQYQALWHPLQALTVNILYALLLITIVFAAQFSRSRFSLLGILWIVFIASNERVLPWSGWLKLNNDWLMLTGVSLFALFALLKDRGLLSVHGIMRMLLIGLCGLGAWGWLWLSNTIELNAPKTAITTMITPLIPLQIPIAITALILLWQNLTKPNLLLSAIVVSFVVWCLHYYQLLQLPWFMVLTVLVAHYLLVIIIDSYFLAYRDELTALPSRRALNQLALSLGRKYTVAMLDIDHFKKFNDTYGHDIGDQVLRLVAAKLAKVKGGGKVFRYGGEEFTIIFSGKTADKATPELEVLRQSIADYAIAVRQPERKSKQARKASKSQNTKTVSVTISIGVAQKEPKQTFEQALKAADVALYRAKKRGRNNVSSSP
ncbi:MAG: diguanylate cyclase (GGDEF)-like protein [Alteromonadaceae bacterium]